MKQLPYPLDFILNYPLRAYVDGVFSKKPSVSVAYVVTHRETSVYVSKLNGSQSFFCPFASLLRGAPTADSLAASGEEIVSGKTSGNFHDTCNKRFGLGLGAEAVLILDCNSMIDDLHLFPNSMGTVSELFDELSEGNAMIPIKEDHEFAMYSASMNLVPRTALVQEMPSGFLVGVPSRYINGVCEWASDTGIILTAVVPLCVAVCNWAIYKGITEKDAFFLIIPGAQKFRVFFIENKIATQFFTAPTEQYVVMDVSSVISDLAHEAPTSVDAPIFIWESHGTATAKLVDSFFSNNSELKSRVITRIDEMFIQSVYGSDMAMSPYAALCDWVASLANKNHIMAKSNPTIF